MKRQQRHIHPRKSRWFRSILLAAAATLSLATATSAQNICGCVDHIPPTAKCKSADLDVTCTPTTLSASAVNNGSCDNVGGSGIASITVSPNTFTCADQGYKTVTLTVKDKAGNVSTCCATVHIECYQPTCSITPIPCTTPPPPPCTCPYSNSTSYPSTGSGSPSSPYVITLGYGPQCVTLHGQAVGGNAYYAYCWSASTSNPAGGGGLSCTTCQDPVFTPTAPGIYTFTMTTFGNATNTGCTPTMCSAVCTITICVKDAQYEDDDDDDGVYYDASEDYGHENDHWNNHGNDHDNGHDNDKKVYLCHVPPGNPSNAHTIYISKNAVAAHLKNHPGDHVGKCNEQCGDKKKKKKDNHNHNSSRTAPGTTPEFITDGDLELTLYPNPTTRDFHINIISNDAAAADVTVYDLTGRIVERHAAQATGSELSVGGNLVPGVYVIEVTHGGISKKVRVTKQ